jgi:hypothetical protein
MLLFALNHVIIPAIDPWSSNLEELFNAYVDCYNLGWDIYDYLGLGSPGLYESACQTGLAAAASVIEEQILAIDAQGAALVVHGDARPVDTDLDRNVDRFILGEWEGIFEIGSADSTLSRPDQKFVADRRAIP